MVSFFHLHLLSIYCLSVVGLQEATGPVKKPGPPFPQPQSPAPPGDDSEAFPDNRGDTIHPESSGSVLGLIRGVCPENLQREAF